MLGLFQGHLLIIRSVLHAGIISRSFINQKVSIACWDYFQVIYQSHIFFTPLHNDILFTCRTEFQNQC